MILINVCIIEARLVVGATPQKISVVHLFICCSTPEAIVCLVFELLRYRAGVLGVKCKMKINARINMF